MPGNKQSKKEEAASATASPNTTGSRANIHKQDPSVTEIGYRVTYIPSVVQDGPRDAEIVLAGVPNVKGDENRDFLVTPADNERFDGVHTFAVVRQVLTMYQRALRRMNNSKSLSWQWNTVSSKASAVVPITVYPLAGQDRNAYYSREEKALKFFYFEQNGRTVKTCSSFDVVAHECGHAILDALRPGYWASWHPQTGGLHEAFGDITAILALLAQMDVCEAIIASCKADLHAKSFFRSLAEQFGQALYGTDLGLRNADNDLTLQDVTEEVHDLSKVFTGAFYDILADVFVSMRDPTLHDDAFVLFQTGEHMGSLLVEALLRGPAQNATYADIANKMISLTTNAVIKASIRQQFERRFVLGRQAVKATRKPVEVSFAKCPCCLKTPEHVTLVENAIANKQRSCF